MESAHEVGEKQVLAGASKTKRRKVNREEDIECGSDESEEERDEERKAAMRKYESQMTIKGRKREEDLLK